MLRSERICYNLNDNIIIPLDNDEDIGNNSGKSRRLTWWTILLIALAASIVIVLLLFVARYCAIRRRRAKTDSFKEQFDEIAVAKQMNNLMNSTPSSNSSTRSSINATKYGYSKRISRPEISYGTPLKSELRPYEFDSDGFLKNFGLFSFNKKSKDKKLNAPTTPTSPSPLSQVVSSAQNKSTTTTEELMRDTISPPPAYNSEDGSSYWDQYKKRKSTYSGKDYLNWKVGKKFEDHLKVDSTGEGGVDILIQSGQRSSLRRSSSNIRRSGMVVMGEFGYRDQNRDSSASINTSGAGVGESENNYDNNYLGLYNNNSSNGRSDVSSSVYSVNSLGERSIGGNSGFDTIIGAYESSNNGEGVSSNAYGRNSKASAVSNLQRSNTIPVKRDENWGSNWI